MIEDDDDEEGDTHVYPLFSREHVMSRDCWCCPIQDPAFPNIWIHHVEH